MMRVRKIALTAGSSVALFGGSLAVAPVANADCAAWELQTCWGAIAYSPKTGEDAWETNDKEQSRAELDAKLQCGVDGPANDCVVVISGPSCLALAGNDAGAYNGGAGPTLDAADAAALADVPNGHIWDHVCSA
jgi:hypothetical protein